MGTVCVGVVPFIDGMSDAARLRCSDKRGPCVIQTQHNTLMTLCYWETLLRCN